MTNWLDGRLEITEQILHNFFTLPNLLSQRQLTSQRTTQTPFFSFASQLIVTEPSPKTECVEGQPSMDISIVHVGVSSLASGLTLEVQAHRSGYRRQDTQGKVPPRYEISSGKAEVIQPLFDVKDVCKAVNEANIRVPTCCSADAGRYVCEFTYFTSLNIDNLRTAFIHVPVLNKPYSAGDLAEGIKDILRVLIQHLRAQHQHKCMNNEVCSVKSV